MSMNHANKNALFHIFYISHLFLFVSANITNVYELCKLSAKNFRKSDDSVGTSMRCVTQTYRGFSRKHHNTIVSCVPAYRT